MAQQTDFDLFEIDKNNPARPAKPKGGGASAGLVDVTGNYYWVLNEPAARQDVPSIVLTEYQITGGQLQQAANYWIKNLTLNALSDIVNAIFENPDNNPETNPYQGLYRAEKTNFTYYFPYFEHLRRKLGNEWSEDDGSIEKAADQIGNIVTHSGGGKLINKIRNVTTITTVARGLVGSVVPNMGAESPEIWSKTSKQTVTVQFDLLNTISFEETIRNFELVNLLSYQNTYYRKNIMLSYPPVIYEYIIPGVKHCPAAVIADLQIDDIGHKRVLLDNGQTGKGQKYVGKTFPDAFRISIALRDLVAESRNILNGLFTGDLVTAIEKNSGQQVNNQSFANQAALASLLSRAIP